MTDATIFTLESATKRGPGNYVRMRSAQLNARAVGRVFNLFPQTVFLVADDGSVELPDEDESFNVDNMDTSLVWTCDGDSSKPADRVRIPGSQWLQPGSSSSLYAYQPTDQTREQEDMSRKRTNFKAQTGKWAPKYTSLLATSHCGR